MRLNEKDYDAILRYYKVKGRNKKSRKQKKLLSESILSNKLCSCIKKIQKTQRRLKERDAIPICKKSVLHKKSLQAKKFTCKSKKGITLQKKNITHKRR